jgi:hypothetical protein
MSPDEEKEESNAQPAYRYRDPLLVLLREESATCAGCVNVRTILGRNFCAKGRKYGERCNLYVERIGVARAR